MNSLNKAYVFRALPLHRDSRTQRYSNVLPNCIFNTWEDSYGNIKKSGIERLKLGRREHRDIYSYPLYLLYLFLFSLLFIRSSNKVICMDLDTYLFVKLGSVRNGNIFLDVVDPIAQTRYRNFPFNKIFDRIECFFIKNKSERVILPACYRLKYYEDRLGVDLNEYLDRVKIYENVIKIPTSSIFNPKNNRLFNNDNITIGYFGSLDSSRGLLELISFCNEYGYNCIVAGRGELADEIVKLSSRHDNLVMLGQYAPKDLATLYSQIDFCWAYYSPHLLLHKYAAPNKYYEHLAFSTPIIFNKVVPLVDKIEDKRTGISISDNLNVDNFVIMNNKIKEFHIESADFTDWNKLYLNYEFKV